MKKVFAMTSQYSVVFVPVYCNKTLILLTLDEKHYYYYAGKF